MIVPFILCTSQLNTNRIVLCHIDEACAAILHFKAKGEPTSFSCYIKLSFILVESISKGQRMVVVAKF